MIIKEYRCKAHGNFESHDENPVCPIAGCTTVDRVFLTPPGFRSDATRRMDNNMESMAKSYGLTDMNNRAGKAVLSQDPSQRQQQESLAREIHQRYGNGWGNLPKDKNATAASVLSQYHAKPENVVGQLQEAGAFVPKPVRVMKDHENLQVKI